MKQSEISVAVPNELADQVELVVDCLRQAMANSSVEDSTEVAVTRASGRLMSPGDLPAVFLCITSAGVAWFTSKWAETYLWPEIEQRIDKPSRRAMEWLIEVLSNLRDDGADPQ